MSTLTIIRTTGTVDVNEAFEFVTQDHLVIRDTIALKPTKPIASQVYGHAQVTTYLGPGRDQSHRKYIALRTD